MIKFIWIFLLFLYSSVVLANDITVTIAPVQSSPLQAAQSGNFRPVVDEPFLVIFSIPYKGEQAPDYPEFTPQGLEVQRRYGSANTFSIGPRGSEKKTVYSYVVSASQTGTAWLKNITVQVDGKVKRVASKTIQIVAERPRQKDIFVAAEIDREKIYVGQGFNITYYFYANRTKVALTDLRRTKDPSFANIIKRFNSPTSNSNGEMINIDGVPYQRIQVYSVRAFAENPGVVDVGPMTVEAFYRTSNFGPNYSKKITSQRQKLNVLPLPGDIPKNFTGLVGEHQFEVVSNRSRFLVNEPIEFTVRVTGEGALEKFNLPPLLEHPELESFDTRSELELDSNQVRGTKKFELTYLARSALKLPSKEVSWSYFNPETDQFVEAKYQLPEIIIAGAASPQSSRPTNDSQADDKQAERPSQPPIDRAGILKSVIAPEFVGLPPVEDYWRWINMALGGVILLLLLLGWVARPKQYKVDPQVTKLMSSIKKEGFNYSRLHHLLLFIDPDKNATLSLRQIVEKSNLTEESKNYFLSAIVQVEKSNFGESGERQVVYKSEPFKNLLELLKK